LRDVTASPLAQNGAAVGIRQRHSLALLLKHVLHWRKPLLLDIAWQSSQPEQAVFARLPYQQHRDVIHPQAASPRQLVL